MNDLIEPENLDLPLLTDEVLVSEPPTLVMEALTPADSILDAPPILTDIVEPAPVPVVDGQSLPNLLKAAGDGFRLEILRVLAQDSFGVLELCRIFAAKQSGMSHHLKVLTSAGLLSTRREGNSIFYRRA